MPLDTINGRLCTSQDFGGNILRPRNSNHNFLIENKSNAFYIYK